MGKKTPLYSGGNNPTVTPKTAPQRAVLPQEAAVLPLITAVLPLPRAVLPLGPERYYRGGQGGTTAYERYYGPHCRG